MVLTIIFIIVSVRGVTHRRVEIPLAVHAQVEPSLCPLDRHYPKSHRNQVELCCRGRKKERKQEKEREREKRGGMKKKHAVSLFSPNMSLCQTPARC